MVIGDPAMVKPDCPLLSVSTREQRHDPKFWKEQNADCVLYYCGPNEADISFNRSPERSVRSHFPIRQIE